MKILNSEDFFEKISINPVKLSDLDELPVYDKMHSRTFCAKLNGDLEDFLDKRYNRKLNGDLPFMRTDTFSVEDDKDEREIALELEWKSIFLPDKFFMNHEKLKKYGIKINEYKIVKPFPLNTSVKEWYAYDEFDYDKFKDHLVKAMPLDFMNDILDESDTTAYSNGVITMMHCPIDKFDSVELEKTKKLFRQALDELLDYADNALKRTLGI